MRTRLVISALLSCGGMCLAMELQGDAARGKVVFTDYCEECHEAYSKEEKVGPGLQGLKNGKLAGGRKVTHDQLLEIINDGPAEMTAFRDRLTEQQKEDVIAFISTL